MKHSLFSQNQDMPVKWYDKFDKQAIKTDIIALLSNDPTDVIEHCKEFSKADQRKYVGQEILNFYEINPKSKQPSKIVIVGDRKLYKPLVETPLPFES